MSASPIPFAAHLGAWTIAFLLFGASAHVAGAADSAASLVLSRQPDGQGTGEMSGELKQWHKITLTPAGPFVHERDPVPDPFTD